NVPPLPPVRPQPSRPAAPEASFEGWVDAYDPTSRGAPPTPPWAHDEPPAQDGPHAPDAGLVARNRVAIAQAIARGAAIRFEYTDREGGRSTRTVDPHALEGSEARAECVRGWCRQRHAARTFHSARIRDLQVLDAPGR
ncbi:MAG: WYL domain-containing protein, partial [Planctomycetia bacterium]